ncbi:MAG: CGGC domain-containing protein [Thermoplasmata archaeon]|jgi:predicted metal-binding protein|nr:CGGC domain-containing protein [Thermoplasmata archaeon]HEU12583.1 CGGC domain-containing protein [Euryarchaeota archaeon]
MSDAVKIGIIICDRYRNCAGGKCFKALMKREGAFSLYKNKDVELAGYTTCGGCPGGNIEYAPEEMKKNGVEIIHFATGFVVGYPPCPYIDYFKSYIEKKFGIEVVIGTHPIPEKYYTVHEKLGTWNEPEWKEKLRYVICDEEKRREYD